MRLHQRIGFRENHGKKHAAAKMRASILNTEQLKMSENNDIKEEETTKYASGHVEISAAARYRKHTGHWNERRSETEIRCLEKPTLFQQEEEESNTDEREKKKDFSRNIRLTGIQSSTVQDSKGEELSSNQSKTFRQQHQSLNTASMLHGMTAANVEKEVEDDEPDSQNGFKKSKHLYIWQN